MTGAPRNENIIQNHLKGHCHAKFAVFRPKLGKNLN